MSQNSNSPKSLLLYSTPKPNTYKSPEHEPPVLPTMNKEETIARRERESKSKTIQQQTRNEIHGGKKKHNTHTEN